MGVCGLCKSEDVTISDRLGFCVDCIRNDYGKVAPTIGAVREKLRTSFSLPARPPRAERSIECRFCSNRCRIGDGERGFCGAWQNREGRLVSSFPDGTVAVSFYYDLLPTNCVADWICPAHTERGFPEFSYSEGAEHGYKNLAVFYQSCNFDCLFCQNWHFRDSGTHRYRKPQEVANAVDEKTACICYFGGDPTPNIRHSLKVSAIARKSNPDRPLRICWETNGAVNRKYLRKIVETALESGGCIKFDLKFASEELSKSLCGVSNREVFENFRFVASYISRRPEIPLLVASTLLIPGYTDEEELSQLAEFIASVDRNIPWALLGFHPDYYLTDLPRTSRRHAEEALSIAERHGIRNSRIGNLHLLGDSY